MEKKEKHRVRSSQGHVEDACQFSWSESKKRRGRSQGIKFMVFNVNQPVRGQYSYIPSTRVSRYGTLNFWEI